MLDPADRTVLTEALRAPVGFRLDHVIATTYTLDLVALLTLPLSFTLSSGDGITESGRVDPIALLEALRRHAGRITVFCQAGRIAVPRRGQLLFGYLEPSVIEVKARREGGVFHPKIAVIRYTADTRDSGSPAEEGPDQAAVRYRLLCGTRNLTFDRSWDTMLVLDGELRRDRLQIVRRNRPLSAFVQALPELASSPISEERNTAIAKFSEELLRVEFQVPDGFSHRADDLVFWPVGLDAKNVWPFDGRIDRMLVISPFIDKTCLEWLKEQADLRALISRSEELDCLQLEAFADIKSCYGLSDAAEADLREEVAGNAAASLNVEEKTEDDLPVEPSFASPSWTTRKTLCCRIAVGRRDCGPVQPTPPKLPFRPTLNFWWSCAAGARISASRSCSKRGRQRVSRTSESGCATCSCHTDPLKLSRGRTRSKRLERLIDQVRRQLVDARMVARCTANDEQGRTFEVRVESDVLVPASFPVGVECSMRPVSFAPDTAVRILAVGRRLLPSSQWPLSR